MKLYADTDAASPAIGRLIDAACEGLDELGGVMVHTGSAESQRALDDALGRAVEALWVVARPPSDAERGAAPADRAREAD